MLYAMNYTPCRYVRISCLRGNPIAIFFIQLIGVSVTGLEPEFQPVVSYLLPHITSHKQDAEDMHLQLLQDLTSRLLFFLPQLETDLASFTDAADSNIRFLSMLAGPFYPILRIVNEREAAKAPNNTLDSDVFRNNHISTLTVSSNFEAQPRRSRSPSLFIQPVSSSIAFRSDAVIKLLRKASKDSHLGIICRIASRALQKLVPPAVSYETTPSGEIVSSLISDEVSGHKSVADYSSLFGEEFKIPDDDWDSSSANLLDIAAVEEGILHVLYACASQPLLCCNLVDSNSDFWSLLPLIQALLPALRPLSSFPDQVDDTFGQWKHPSALRALSQIVTMSSSSSVYCPLLRACAGYLASFLSSHAKVACVLIDLCCGPFSPWIPIVVAKVDLAVDLLADVLGIIQGSRQSIAQARAALKYVVLALSGHVDDVLSMYKEVKLKLLFLLEMLEPFLDPAITAVNSTVVFGDVSTTFTGEQEKNCATALNVIRIAVRRPAVLPSLESEWRRGSVTPSVLLSILGPHMPLPLEVDRCKCLSSKVPGHESVSDSSLLSHGARSTIPDESDGKIDVSETARIDVSQEANLFAPPEIKRIAMTDHDNLFIRNGHEKNNSEGIQYGTGGKNTGNNVSADLFLLDNSFSVGYFNMQADYLQLVNHEECESRAYEFQHLAVDLCSHPDISPEGHDAAIDALLLAAECYVNPFFMMSFRPTSKLISHMTFMKSKISQTNDIMELDKNFRNSDIDLKTVAHLERKRDKTVLEILLKAAKLDRDYQKKISQGEQYQYGYDDITGDISVLDMQSADAVTLVRRNQELLCHFVMQQLQREQHSSHEILLQSLLFILQSATELFCPPDNVIDIILRSAENLNRLIASLYHQLKEGNIQFDPEKLHGVQRHWGILQRLVITSSGTDDEADVMHNTQSGFQYRTLVPSSSWTHQISKFSNCPYPLARFLGWMAVSRYAKQYMKERLYLASDLSQLTSLLSIYTDELVLLDNTFNYKAEWSNSEKSDTIYDLHSNEKFDFSDRSDGRESYHILHPDLHKFFPSMRKQFNAFGEIILQSVGMHLKCLPGSVVPDVLCWFSDLCLWPYPVKDHPFSLSASNHLKGYAARNAKVVILYVLESIVCEHMEAILPEMPRIAHILISLCKSSYCDVSFLESVLCLLKPLISFFLGGYNGEKQLKDFSCHLDFELSFEELFNSIRCIKDDQDSSGECPFQGALLIFILGTLFPDLSFGRKREALQSLLPWVGFTTEPTSSFHNYLFAFLKLMDNCAILLIQYLNSFGISIPVEMIQSPEPTSASSLDGNTEKCYTCPNGGLQSSAGCANISDPQIHHLSPDEVKEFSEGLEILISKLIPAIEVSWKLHCQIATKLILVSSKCLLFSRCLHSISQEDTPNGGNGGDTSPSDLSDKSSKHWRVALEGFTGSVLTIQQNQCWQVASLMLDYLFMLPQNISLDCVLSPLCSAIKHFCWHAPRISWRLQTDKWLSSLFSRGIDNLDCHEASMVDLFTTMLDSSEPEQLSIALHLLGRVVGLDTNNSVAKSSPVVRQILVTTDSAVSVGDSVISVLVSNTWDRVGALALSHPSMLLRTHAMALLSGYIPFAERIRLQSFLVASDCLLQGMEQVSRSMEEGHLTRLSLGLLASACLFSPSEDIDLIPESVWRNLTCMGVSRTGLLDDSAKSVCLALCRLRSDSNDARGVLKEALSSGPALEPTNPNFRSTREAILQVLSCLTTVQSYFDFFSKKIDQESEEIQEAEIERELLLKERAMQEVSGSSREETNLPRDILHDEKDKNRLQQIKDEIRSIEKGRLREEIIARRQSKLLMRQARQVYLEEAAAREMELLQELDRERANELECELERQRQLELERAKTRELQFNLDIERERHAQKEIQRELEQVESGVRPSRREYSNSNSRPRERYRERDNGRPGHDGGMRTNRSYEGGGSSQMGNSGPILASPTPTVMLAGSRSFSGQLPTILQQRDRSDERGMGYEDSHSLEGGRDSGDGSSIGDPELASGLDGLTGGYGSGTRHGSRGSSKSRQVVERRERDGRREGKWERKH